VNQEVLETGLTYDGITPVRVYVTRREGRYSFSDEGGAVAAAGVDYEQCAFDDHIRMGDYSANVSRKGVVFIPATERANDKWLTKLTELVAQGSVLLYEALLELDD
jgi:hypothetical protein